MPDAKLGPCRIRSALPLFHQIAHHYEECIPDGGLSAGSRIASTTELAQTLSVNEGTLYNALPQLGDHGLVERCHVAGTFVRPGVANRTLAIVFGEVCFICPDLAFFNARWKFGRGSPGM